MERRVLIYLTGVVVIVLGMIGCTRGALVGEQDSVVETSTMVATIEIVDTSQPTASPTLLPTQVAGQALQVYRTMLIIQANSEQLQATAALVDTQEGELNLKESPMMMSLSVSIVSVDDLITNLQAPNNVLLPWQRALIVHQETKEILSSWLRDATVPSEVIGATMPVIGDIQRDVGEVETTLHSEYGYDRTELERERQAVLEIMRQMLGTGGE
jgi:hypothetical protein